MGISIRNLIEDNCRLGYCCINQTLSAQKPKITTSRGIQNQKFKKEGLELCSRLALDNCKDLFRILNWNELNDIRLFRISSEMFPWGSQYSLNKLPDFDKIRKVLELCGDYARKNGHRLTFHPDHFVKLASNDERILLNSVRELEMHSEIFDLMQFEPSQENCINIHVGAVYDGNKNKTLEQFCENFSLLSDNLKKRLTVENDDKKSLYSTDELFSGVYEKIGIPIVFDYHHHSLCNHNNLSEEEALKIAAKTWNTTQLVHYSESRREEFNDQTIKEQAHSDFYKKVPNNYKMTLDIDLECKMKELALLEMRKMCLC